MTEQNSKTISSSSPKCQCCMYNRVHGLHYGVLCCKQCCDRFRKMEQKDYPCTKQTSPIASNGLPGCRHCLQEHFDKVGFTHNSMKGAAKSKTLETVTESKENLKNEGVSEDANFQPFSNREKLKTEHQKVKSPTKTKQDEISVRQKLRLVKDTTVAETPEKCDPVIDESSIEGNSCSVSTKEEIPDSGVLVRAESKEKSCVLSDTDFISESETFTTKTRKVQGGEESASGTLCVGKKATTSTTTTKKRSRLNRSAWSKKTCNKTLDKAKLSSDSSSHEIISEFSDLECNSSKQSSISNESDEPNWTCGKIAEKPVSFSHWRESEEGKMELKKDRTPTKNKVLGASSCDSDDLVFLSATTTKTNNKVENSGPSLKEKCSKIDGKKGMKIDRTRFKLHDAKETNESNTQCLGDKETRNESFLLPGNGARKDESENFRTGNNRKPEVQRLLEDFEAFAKSTGMNQTKRRCRTSNSGGSEGSSVELTPADSSMVEAKATEACGCCGVEEECSLFFEVQCCAKCREIYNNMKKWKKVERCSGDMKCTITKDALFSCRSCLIRHMLKVGFPPIQRIMSLFTHVLENEDESDQEKDRLCAVQTSGSQGDNKDALNIEQSNFAKNVEDSEKMDFDTPIVIGALSSREDDLTENENPVHKVNDTEDKRSENEVLFADMWLSDTNSLESHGFDREANVLEDENSRFENIFLEDVIRDHEEDKRTNNEEVCVFYGEDYFSSKSCHDGNFQGQEQFSEEQSSKADGTNNEPKEKLVSPEEEIVPKHIPPAGYTRKRCSICNINSMDCKLSGVNCCMFCKIKFLKLSKKSSLSCENNALCHKKIRGLSACRSCCMKHMIAVGLKVPPRTKDQQKTLSVVNRKFVLHSASDAHSSADSVRDNSCHEYSPQGARRLPIVSPLHERFSSPGFRAPINYKDSNSSPSSSCTNINEIVADPIAQQVTSPSSCNAFLMEALELCSAPSLAEVSHFMEDVEMEDAFEVVPVVVSPRVKPIFDWFISPQRIDLMSSPHEPRCLRHMEQVNSQDVLVLAKEFEKKQETQDSKFVKRPVRQKVMAFRSSPNTAETIRVAFENNVPLSKKTKDKSGSPSKDSDDAYFVSAMDEQFDGSIKNKTTSDSDTSIKGISKSDQLGSAPTTSKRIASLPAKSFNLTEHKHKHSRQSPRKGSLKKLKVSLIDCKLKLDDVLEVKDDASCMPEDKILFSKTSSSKCGDASSSPEKCQGNKKKTQTTKKKRSEKSNSKNCKENKSEPTTKKVFPKPVEKCENSSNLSEGSIFGLILKAGELEDISDCSENEFGAEENDVLSVRKRSPESVTLHPSSNDIANDTSTKKEVEKSESSKEDSEECSAKKGVFVQHERLVEKDNVRRKSPENGSLSEDSSIEQKRLAKNDEATIDSTECLSSSESSDDKPTFSKKKTTCKNSPTKRNQSCLLQSSSLSKEGSVEKSSKKVGSLNKHVKKKAAKYKFPGKIHPRETDAYNQSALTESKFSGKILPKIEGLSIRFSTSEEDREGSHKKRTITTTNSPTVNEGKAAEKKKMKLESGDCEEGTLSMDASTVCKAKSPKKKTKSLEENAKFSPTKVKSNQVQVDSGQDAKVEKKSAKSGQTKRISSPARHQSKKSQSSESKIETDVEILQNAEGADTEVSPNSGSASPTLLLAFPDEALDYEPDVQDVTTKENASNIFSDSDSDSDTGSYRKKMFLRHPRDESGSNRSSSLPKEDLGEDNSNYSIPFRSYTPPVDLPKSTAPKKDNSKKSGLSEQEVAVPEKLKDANVQSVFPVSEFKPSFKEQLDGEEGAPDNDSVASGSLESTSRDMRKGYCYTFINRGNCFRQNCRYRHEIPPKPIEFPELKYDYFEKVCKNGVLNKAVDCLEKVPKNISFSLKKKLLMTFIGSVIHLRQLALLKCAGVFIEQHSITSEMLLSEIVVLCKNIYDGVHEFLLQIVRFCETNEVVLTSAAVAVILHVFSSGEYPLWKLVVILHFVVISCRYPAPKDLLDRVLADIHTQPSRAQQIYRILVQLGEDVWLNLDQAALSKLLDVLQNDPKCVQESMSLEKRLTCMRIDALKDNPAQWIKKSIENHRWADVANQICVYESGQIVCGILKAVHEVLVLQGAKSGEYFRHLASAVTEDSRFKYNARNYKFLGQIGTALLMENHYEKRFEAAYEVLQTMHKCNLDYYRLQKPAMTQHEDNPHWTMITPCRAALVAVDTCLEVQEFMSAFSVFKCFEWVEPSNRFLGDVCYEDTLWRARLLKSLAENLLRTNCLDEGIVVLKRLFATISEDLTDKNLKVTPQILDVDVLYANYMREIVREKRADDAMEILQYFKKMDVMLVLSDNLMRSILILYKMADKEQEAKSLFSWFSRMGLYSVSKPSQQSHVLHIKSYLTSEEIVLHVLLFFQDLYKVIFQQTKAKFEERFSFSFVINAASASEDEDWNMLRSISPSIPHAIERILFAIEKCMTPPLKVGAKITSDKIAVCPNSVYQYYVQNKSKYHHLVNVAEPSTSKTNTSSVVASENQSKSECGPTAKNKNFNVTQQQQAALMNAVSQCIRKTLPQLTQQQSSGRPPAAQQSSLFTPKSSQQPLRLPAAAAVTSREGIDASRVSRMNSGRNVSSANSQPSMQTASNFLSGIVPQQMSGSSQNDVFNKVTAFLKTRLLQKHCNGAEGKARTLACEFLKSRPKLSALDKAAMKHLHDFSVIKIM